MWLWGANSWAHSSDLPTPEDSTPTVLARRHWSGHQALGASCRTTADGGLPSSCRPEDLARSSHRTQKKKEQAIRMFVWCQWKQLIKYLLESAVSTPLVSGKTVDYHYDKLLEPEETAPLVSVKAVPIGQYQTSASLWVHYCYQWPPKTSKLWTTSWVLCMKRYENTMS